MSGRLRSPQERLDDARRLVARLRMELIALEAEPLTVSNGARRAEAQRALSEALAELEMVETLAANAAETRRLTEALGRPFLAG